MYRILERGKKNGNPDETELRGRTEEGKKWRTLQKVKNYGAHKKITNYTQKELKIITAV